MYEKFRPHHSAQWHINKDPIWSRLCGKHKEKRPSAPPAPSDQPRCKVWDPEHHWVHLRVPCTPSPRKKISLRESQMLRVVFSHPKKNKWAKCHHIHLLEELSLLIKTLSSNLSHWTRLSRMVSQAQFFGVHPTNKTFIIMVQDTWDSVRDPTILIKIHTTSINWGRQNLPLITTGAPKRWMPIWGKLLITKLKTLIISSLGIKISTRTSKLRWRS